MRVTSVVFAVLLFSLSAVPTAQAPATAPAAPAGAKPAAPAGAKPAAPAAARPAGTLLQVMRGILFPASNIIFLAQDTDPTKTPATPAEAKFGNPYGGWVNVENAAIALGEAANLLTIPGRLCSNNKPAPVNRADWPKFVQGLRDASQVAYKAAQSKNQDNIVDAAGTVTEACSACHDVYREKPNPSLRCTP
jgi:Cytochrome C'